MKENVDKIWYVSWINWCLLWSRTGINPQIDLWQNFRGKLFCMLTNGLRSLLRTCNVWLGGKSSKAYRVSPKISPCAHLELGRLWHCWPVTLLIPLPNQITSATRIQTPVLRLSDQRANGLARTAHKFKKKELWIFDADFWWLLKFLFV